MRQRTAEAATHGGADDSLLAHQLDRRLALSDSLRTAARVRLSAIPYTDKEICDLGTFTLFTLHLFYAGRRHLSAVTEIIRLIKRVDELHT